MPDQPSPRGTYLKIADSLRRSIQEGRLAGNLPSEAALMREHGVSRNTIRRALKDLAAEKTVEPVSGIGWRVRDPGNSQPLHERLVDLITEGGLEVGALFPSATVLSEQFGVSRPTMSKAMDKLEAAGLLSPSQQGKPRTVLALPTPTDD